MILKSLYKLAETNNEGVYKFLSRALYEKYENITLSQNLILYASVTKFKECAEKDFDHFKNIAAHNVKLIKILTDLVDSGKYNFLLDEEEIKDENLDQEKKYLLDEYIKIFGRENIIFSADEEQNILKLMA